MVLQRKRSLFLGLGLSVALVLAVGLPATASAVSTLTGESFSGSSTAGNSPTCPTNRFSVSGPAIGPYPGTFEETGQLAPNFSATFTIRDSSGTATVTGSKQEGSLGACATSVASISTGAAPYTATIHTPNGNFHDEGLSAVSVVIAGSFASLRESFTSSLTEARLIGPTSKDQCKRGGWKNFPQFKNQGQCEKSVKG
jgi:hypothetical protein